MPQIIELPDGTEAEFPDSMTTEEIEAVLQKQFSPETATAIAEPFEEEDGILDSLERISNQEEITQRKSPFFEFLEEADQFTKEVLNTATFGLSDIVAGVGSALAEELFGGGEGAVAFNKPREAREAFREINPVTSGVASFVGGFINPASGPAGTFVQKGTGLVSKTLRSGGVGAGFGGGQVLGEETGEIIGKVTAGEDVDLAQSGERVAIGTGLGASIGGAVPPVAKLLGFLGSQGIDFLRRISAKGQETRGLRKVAEALERDGLTPQQALERIEKLGPEAALIDAGENSRALAFTVGAKPGAGKTKITQFIRDRQEGIRDPITGNIKGGQVNRIQDHIDQLVKANFFTETQRLANMNNAAKLYSSAYAANQNIESRVINRILKTPSGRQAFKNARVTLQNLRKNLSKTDPELAAQLRETGEKATGKGVGRGLKLEFLDQVKKELFDLESAAKSQFGKATAKSRSITELRRDLIKEMDKVDVTAQAGPNSLKVDGGDYAKARLLAGDKLANQEALELGSDFLSKAKFSTPEELGVALQEMSPEARHLFRVGAAQSLKGKLADIVSRADATKKLIDIQNLERKIQLAFGDPAKFRKYTELLENEKELFRAVTEVLGNSKTAARGAALDDLAQDPGRVGQGIRDFMAGDFFSASRNILSSAKGRLTQTDLEADKIAKILTQRNIEGLAEQVGPPVSRITETGQPRDLGGRLLRALSSTAGTQVE